MNITVIGKFYTEGFALHIAETLQCLSHNVAKIDPGIKPLSAKTSFGHRINQLTELIYQTSGGIPLLRARRSHRLLLEIYKSEPEVIIVCHDFLTPNEVASIKRHTNAIIVMWFPDSMANFGRAYFMNAKYDALFFKDPYLVRILSQILWSPVFYLPECFNPFRHSLLGANLEALEAKFPGNIDLAIAGNQHSWRVAFYKHLADFDVKVWGNPPPLWMPENGLASMFQGKSIFNQDKAFVFNKAKIVVNNLLYSEIEGVNARCFEVAGAGGFQIIDFRKSLHGLFQERKEIISFSGISDLREKINYWLPRNDERKEIASASFRRALQEHTYQHRLNEIFSVIKKLGT